MEGQGAKQRRATRWLVCGRVQGVGFRWYVRQAAGELAVTGDVRNLPDGRVEIRAAGTVDQLQSLLSRVKQGPPGARVEGVEKLEVDAGFLPDEFRIRH